MRLHLQVRNHTAELERVATAVAAFGERHGLGEKEIFDVNLALDEVLTNVIWYAFEDEGEHSIDVRLRLDGGELEVEVEDEGRAFDPLSVAPVETELGKPLEEREVGGLGMHLVHHAMHALAYRREGERNILTMRRSVARRTT